MTWNAKISVEVDYGAIDNLANPVTIRRVEDRANELNARETYRRSQQKVPIDKGNLKKSGKVQRGEGVVWEMLYIGGTGGREYASHIEYGTKKMPAQPFIRPAIEETDEEANGYQALREVTGVS